MRPRRTRMGSGGPSRSQVSTSCPSWRARRAASPRIERSAVAERRTTTSVVGTSEAPAALPSRARIVTVTVMVALARRSDKSVLTTPPLPCYLLGHLDPEGARDRELGRPAEPALHGTRVVHA